MRGCSCELNVCAQARFGATWITVRAEAMKKAARMLRAPAELVIEIKTLFHRAGNRSVDICNILS